MSLDLPSIRPSSARRRAARTLCCWLGPIAACAALAACGGDEATGEPDFGSSALGPSGSTNGSSSNPVAPGASNQGTSFNNPVGNATPPLSGTPGTNNEPSQGNGTPTAGNNNAGNTQGAGPPGAAGSGNTAPGNTGAGGAPGTPPPGGAAGSAQMPQQPPQSGAAGSAQMPPEQPQQPPPQQPPPQQPPPQQPPPPPPPPQEPAGPDIDCPAGATFCSGFEGTALPAGTAHAVGSNPAPGAFVLDTTEAFEGNQSLSVPATGNGGFFYRAFAVPVPGQDFWVRLYMHLSTPLGDNSHDSVFGASSGGLTADVNGESLVELSEQFDEILLNTDDALFNPPTNMTLPANEWLCMEAHYVGGSGNVEIFVNETSVINATAYRPQMHQTFRFGYMRYNDDRTIRYDNVVVAPQRVGCP